MQRFKLLIIIGMLLVNTIPGTVFALMPTVQSPIKAPLASRGKYFHLPIVLFHHIRPTTATMSSLAQGLSVTPAAFEEQLAYLKNNAYTDISLENLSYALEHGLKIPRNAFALTFDDGYADLYTYAWPLLKKYGIRATAFIIVNRVGTPDYATWSQLKEMQDSGIIDIQSHTLNHPLLTRLKPEQARYEIEQSKSILEKKLSKKIFVFCYPYGDYNATMASLVKKSGYSLAVTTKGGTWHTSDLRFELSRIRFSTSDVKTTLDRKVKLTFGQKTP